MLGNDTQVGENSLEFAETGTDARVCRVDENSLVFTQTGTGAQDTMWVRNRILCLLKVGHMPGVQGG